MKVKKVVQVEESIDVIICNLCGKELEGQEANPIKVMIAGAMYFNFHLCEEHWTPLMKQLQEIQSSTGTTNMEEK